VLIEAALELIGPMLLEMAVRNVAAPAAKRIAAELITRPEDPDQRATLAPVTSLIQTLNAVPAISIVSTTPGRLRVEVAGVRTDPRLGDVLTNAVRTLGGVERAEANPRTGRLLIQFDEAEQDAATLIETLDRARTRYLAPAARPVGKAARRSRRHLAAVV
jgi:hypothetical protein